MKIKYNVTRLIVWRDAVVLYPYVLFRQCRHDVTDQLFRHELEHAYQVQRMGWLKFYASYLWLLIRYGYKKHPYEVEATAKQDLALTDTERVLKEA